MKKNALIILVFSLISFGSFANNTSDRPSPEEIAEMQTKRLKEQVNLSEVQYLKMYAVNLEMEKTNQAKMAEKDINIKAVRAAYVTTLEEILTPEQFTKLKEDKARNMNRKGKNKGKGKKGEKTSKERKF